MKHLNVANNAEVVKGRDRYGIVPWKVVDLEHENLYAFSVGIDESKVKVWGDLVALKEAGYEVGAASEWDSKSRDAVIKAF